MGCCQSRADKYEAKDKDSQYEGIDAHARKSPSHLKTSPEDLVKYMMSYSKDPKMLVRGFFVWISENIRYDVDGYFGRAPRAASDATAVMRSGQSVCEGYANVFEILCSIADIPVKNISGFAKGYGYTAEKKYTTTDNTNHAWNAVQLGKKWFLIDSTWGSGNLDSNVYKKKFEDFYFLANPKHLIFTHFPYMDNNMEESKKWQLLSRPVSLEEFNRSVKYKPTAFKLGLQATSHQNGYLDMKNELQMSFNSASEEELVVTGRLMLKEGNVLREQPNATFGNPAGKTYKLFVHPPKKGVYKLYLFCQKASDKNLQGIPEVMEYTINCSTVKDEGFEYPKSYIAAGNEKVVLHEPLRGKLPANKEVKFKISAPSLQKIVIGSVTLDKKGNLFTGAVKTGFKGERMVAYGSHGGTKLDGLYEFKII